MPARAAALQAAWRPTARPKAYRSSIRRSSTGGIRTHTHQGLSLVATTSWRTVPHKSRALGGNRTHTSVIPRRQAATTSQGPYTFSIPQSTLRDPQSEERPVGVEPTRPPWQGDRLPLHHGRVRISTDHRQYIRRELHPRDHFGRVACCCYTTDAREPVPRTGLEPAWAA